MNRRDPSRIRPPVPPASLTGPLVVAGALVLLAAAVARPRPSAPALEPGPEPPKPPVIRSLLIAGTFVGFVGSMLHWREATHILMRVTRPFWSCSNAGDFITQFAATEAEQVILFFVALGFIGFPILAGGVALYAAYRAWRRR